MQGLWYGIEYREEEEEEEEYHLGCREIANFFS